MTSCTWNVCFHLLYGKDRETGLAERQECLLAKLEYLIFRGQLLSRLFIGDPFCKVPSRLSRSAEPSQQTCSLQSAGLPSLVATPFSCTTTHPLVVRLYTLQLYDYTSFSCTTIHPLVVRLFTFQLYDYTFFGCTTINAE